MEESLKAIYMGFSVLVFISAITILFAMQRSFDITYEKIMEVVNGGFLW